MDPAHITPLQRAVLGPKGALRAWIRGEKRAGLASRLLAIWKTQGAGNPGNRLESGCRPCPTTACPVKRGTPSQGPPTRRPPKEFRCKERRKCNVFINVLCPLLPIPYSFVNPEKSPCKTKFTASFVNGGHLEPRAFKVLFRPDPVGS